MISCPFNEKLLVLVCMVIWLFNWSIVTPLTPLILNNIVLIVLYHKLSLGAWTNDVEVKNGWLTTVPAGFTDCPTLSSIYITDGDGHVYSTTFSLISNLEGYTTPDIVTDNGFNIALPYTVTITACVIKDGITCSIDVEVTINTGTGNRIWWSI